MVCKFPSTRRKGRLEERRNYYFLRDHENTSTVEIAHTVSVTTFELTIFINIMSFETFSFI